MPRSSFRSRGAIALVMVLALPMGAAGWWQDAGSEQMRRGLELIEQGQPEAALAAFEEAIQEAPELAAAHYYAGMALGQLQRFDEALVRFMSVAELDPGNGQAHVMACRTAYSLQDYDEAWNQGILAAQAGMDMADAFVGLEQVSTRPADFEERMAAPRVFVADIDVSRVGAVDASPETTSGASMTLAQRLDDIVETRRQLALSLLRSQKFSVIQAQEPATYVLLVEIDDITAFSGLLKLVDNATGETAVSRPVTLPSSIGALRSETDRLVGFLVSWLEER